MACAICSSRVAWWFLGVGYLMWSFGLLLVMFGYALVYTGVMNVRSGGQGPSLFDSLGWPRPTITGMGKSAANPAGTTGRRAP